MSFLGSFIKFVRKLFVPRRKTRRRFKKKSKRRLPPPRIKARRALKKSSLTGDKKRKVVGEITHYFPRIQVVVVKLTKAGMAAGDRVRIIGKTTDFEQIVKSMQMESVDVKAARKGQLVGLKVEKEARVGDFVWKL